MIRLIHKKAVKPIDNNRGAMLIFTLLLFMVVAIVGTSMVASSARNHKSLTVNSESESAYYIADAGVHYMVDQITKAVENYEANNEEFESDGDFFDEFYSAYHGSREVLYNFEKNRGEQPQAEIIVTRTRDGAKSNDYKITSIGKIGDNKRTVSSEITVGWERAEPTTNPAINPATDYKIFMEHGLFIYSPAATFGLNVVNTNEGTVFAESISGLHNGYSLNAKNIYLTNPPAQMPQGNVIGNKNNPGSIFVNGNFKFGNYGMNVYGNVYVKNGTFNPGNVSFNGEINVDGNVEINTWPGTFNKIKYTGNLTGTSNIINSVKPKLEKVPSIDTFTIPEMDLTLKTDDWFATKGYTNVGTAKNHNLKSNTIIFADDYQSIPLDQHINNVIIVSKKDIVLKTAWHGGLNLENSALIAPYGKVIINQQNFEGLVISKTGFKAEINGGVTVKMLGIEKFFSNIEDIPFYMTSGYSEDDEGGSSGGTGESPGGGTIIPGEVTAGVSVKSPIKEE